MKVILIGAGRWGRNYIHTLRDTPFTLVAIVDPMYTGSECENRFNSVEDIDLEYDAAIIATPIQTHYKLAKQLLLLDKHVLIEKPLSLSKNESEELVKLSLKQNENCVTIQRSGHVKTMMVGYNVLYLPIYEHMNAEDILTYSSQRTVEYNNNGMHVLYDLLCHDIAMVVKIFRRAPDSVTYIGTRDTGTLMLRYGHKMLSCYASRFYKKRRTVNCRMKNMTLELDDISKKLRGRDVIDYGNRRSPLLAQCLDFYEHAVNNKSHEENMFIAVTVDEVIERVLK